MKSADNSARSLQNVISGVRDISGSYTFDNSLSSSPLIQGICISREFRF